MDNSSDTPNLPSDQKSVKSTDLTIESMTDQNWLFVKYFLETADLHKAYEMAGYQGVARSAPFELFKRLKPVIEELVNARLQAKLKYSNDLDKALSVPLVDKESFSVSEWLRIRKFAANMVPEIQQPKQQLSVLVVNRYGSRNIDKVINQPDVIDLPPLIDPNEGKDVK